MQEVEVIAPTELPEERPHFPVVGIGASAGGLEALTALIHEFHIDSMAFVVVQHLSPNHESMLPELLARAARMTVLEMKDGMEIKKNHIYVAPPNANVAVLHGVLHVMIPRGPVLPIDFFFRSLAEDLGTNAIGVVLSGMGTDGTVGLKEIRLRGGLTFCQEPSSARFDAMPRSAIESGCVDRVLPPAELARELMTMSKHPFIVRAQRDDRTPEKDDLAKLFILLRSRFGNDLSVYKTTTINRRVERRMAVNKMDTLADYVRLVQRNATELEALYGDLLIGVTSFFRDTEPFDILKEVVFPRILERKQLGSIIRVWVPACASGEEAYSIAICLLEALDGIAREYRIQIFGTDVDKHAIDRARRGVYPVNIELDVSPERLARFFERTSAGYTVTRRVRDCIVFFRAKRAKRRAVFTARPRELPQPAHLLAAAGAKEGAARSQLCAQPGLLLTTRYLRDGGGFRGSVFPRGSQEQDLREEKSAERGAHGSRSRRVQLGASSRRA